MDKGTAISHYFSRSYNLPFVPFSASHGGAIAVIVAACAALAIWLRRADLAPRRREFIRHVLATFALLNVIIWYVWEWNVGLSSWAYSLPLQICTAATILCPLMLWWRSYRLFEIVYFWGFAGATQALLTPDIGPYDFPHFVFITFFTSHGSIFLCLVFMLVAERYRPRWSSIGRVLLVTLGCLVLAGLANWLTGGNYMYLAYKPDIPTLIDALGPWPWYIFGLIGLGAAAFVIVYLPFAVRDWLVQLRRRVSAV